jgi:hypothetical protein
VKTAPGMQNIVRKFEEFKWDKRKRSNLQKENKKRGKSTQMNNLETNGLLAKEVTNK